MVAWYKQQWAAEEKEAAAAEKARVTAEKKHKGLLEKRGTYLATPGKVEEDVAKLAEYFSPSKQKVRVGKYSRAETLRRREQGGPMEGFQRETNRVYQDLLRQDEGLETSPELLLAKAGQSVMKNQGYLEALQRNKFKADTSMGRLFGALGPDENVRKPPGYDTWKADEKVKQDVRTKSEWFHPAESAAMGAGTYVAFETAKKVFLKRAVGAGLMAMIPLPYARVAALAKVASAAAMAIPSFFAYDVGQNVVRHSRWAKARQEEGKLDRADVAEAGLGILVSGGLAKVGSKLLRKKLGKATAEKIRHEAEFPTEPGVAEQGFTIQDSYPRSTYPRRQLGQGEFFPPVPIAPGDTAAKVISSEKAMAAADDFSNLLRKEFKLSDYDMIENTLAGARKMLPVSRAEYPIALKGTKSKTLNTLIGEDPWIFTPLTKPQVRKMYNGLSEAEVGTVIDVANKRNWSLERAIQSLERTKKVAAGKVAPERAAKKARKVKATKEVKKAFVATEKNIEESVAITEVEASSKLKTPLMDMVKQGKVEEVINSEAITGSINTILDSMTSLGKSGAEAKGIKAAQSIVKVIGNSKNANLAMHDLMVITREAVSTAKAGGTSVPSGKGIFRDWSRKWGGKIALGTIGLTVAGALPEGYIEASDEASNTWKFQQLSEETELSPINTDALTSANEDIVKEDGTLSDSIKNFGKDVLEVGTVALSTLTEFIGPSEVEAAVLSTVSKAAIPAIKTAISKGKKTTTKMFQEMFDANMVHVPLAEGAKSVERPMEAMHMAGEIVNQVDSIKGALTGEKTPFLGWLMSPFGQSQILYKSYSEKIGGKVKSYFMSPVPELASMQSTRVWNTQDYMKATGNILHDAGLPKMRTKVILDKMAPLANKYKADEIAYSAAKMREEHLDTKLKKVLDSMNKKKKGWDKKKALDSQKEIIAEMEKTNTAVAELSPKHEQFVKEWRTTVMKVAEEEPATRIALMVEDAHIHEGLTELPKLLTEAERQAVVHIKDMMGQYSERFAEVGEKTISNRAYIHHAWHPEWTKAAAEERLLSFGIKNDVVPLSKLFHRSKFSKQMAPDINYVMQKYIFDSERRLQMLRFWDKKKIFSKDSWASHYEWVKTYGSNELKTFWENINKGFTPPAETTANEWANRYSAIEMLRLIAFAPSTAFKHIFKNIGTASSFGLTEFASHIPASVAQSARVVSHNIATSMAPALGLKAPKQLRRLEDQVMKSVTGTAKGINVFAGIDLEPAIRKTAGFWPVFDKALASTNRAGGSLIGLVETVDRAHTFRATFDVAAKKGMTTQQAMYSYWSNVLEMNFLSGEMNPSWVRKPIVRAIMLFQNTAYKIFERRALTAIRGGRDIKSAVKAFKGKTVTESIKDLHDVGRWMVGLEKDLKKNIILENLTSTKDVLGVPLVQRAMRETVMSGLVLGGGSAIGLNLFPQVMHVPFVAHGAHEPTMAANPLVHAIFRTTMGHEQGGRDIAEEDFWFTSFLDEWLRGTGYMNMTANKIARTIKGDIPTIYEADTGSIFPAELLYLFSVPRKKEAMQ